MQEFWFCAGCKSMNRADAERCYKCRAPRVHATLATVAERKQGVVLTPGLDDANREVAWALMYGHRYISAWRLGYAAAGLILVTLALAALNIGFQLVVMAANGLFFDPDRLAAFQWDPTQAAVLGMLYAAFSVVGIAAVIVVSAFLCLTSMNSPALGSGTPRFGPLRSALWVVETWLWFCWGCLCFSVVPYIVARAVGVLGGPFGALGKPRRLLQDLMDRLGVPGSSETRHVGFWAALWATARGIDYLLIVGPVLILLPIILLILLITSLLGIPLTRAPEGQVQLFSMLIALFILLGQLAADGAGLFMLARIMTELAHRQRVREAWVRSGVVAGGPRTSAAGPGGVAASPAPLGPQPGPLQAAAPARPAPPQPTYVVGQSVAPAPAAPPAAAAPPQPVPPPAPRPSNAPVPRYLVDRPGEEPISWSRQIERAPRPESEPVAQAELPPAWLERIERSVPVQQPAAGGEAQATEPRPVIQPSAASLSRYRVPQSGAPAEKPAETPDEKPSAPESGEGA